MIPTFPDFKKIELLDSAEVRKYTDHYKPYSDFNFTSLWSWDTKGDLMLSILNDNLVIRISDYITDEVFHSFIGSNQINETIHTLLNFQSQNNFGNELKLIPETALDNFNSSDESLIVIPDEDNFDYVFTLEKLVTYDGNKSRSKRNLVNRFKRFNFEDNVRVSEVNLDHDQNRDDIRNIVSDWLSKNKEVSNSNEVTAINRLFDMDDKSNIVAVIIYIDNEPKGFVINEVLSNRYALLHFEKADRDFIGIYAYLMQANAEILLNKKCNLLNYEQDLGLPGLRLGKRSYRPFEYLKKYVIRRL